MIIRRLLHRRQTLKALGRTRLPPLRPVHTVLLVVLCGLGAGLTVAALNENSDGGLHYDRPLQRHAVAERLAAQSIGKLRVAVQDSAAVAVGNRTAVLLGGLDGSAASRPLIDRLVGGSDARVGRL